MPDAESPRRAGRPRPARRVGGRLSRRRRDTGSESDQAAASAPIPAAGSKPPPEVETPDEPGPREAGGARRRLGRALVRPGRGQIIAAVILFVVGLGGVMQLRLNSASDAYTSARREDLIQILDGLGDESRRLESESAELQQTRTELESGANSQAVARRETERRLSELSILAGTAPATGPGIRITITDPERKVGAQVLLDAVEEMRDAGAEVIEINDQVRVVAQTWFADQNGQLVVDGQVVARPLTLEVIGDPHSLEEGARFRGGLVSEITGPRVGGTAEIESVQRLRVSSLHSPRRTQYAQPSSTAPTPR